MIVSGLGMAGPGDDPTAFLRVRKSRKFMGVQDALAVVAAGRAVAAARLSGGDLGDRTGLYLVVGHIPFERADVEPLARASAVDGRFSAAAFCTAGDATINPLLTFRCLPNMPAYHVSANFGLTGPYVVSYPGPGQAALVLQEALAALAAGEVDVALVGGVAHQRNFLVESLASRRPFPDDPATLLDAAGVLVLERKEDARRRDAPEAGRLLSLDLSYLLHDPYAEPPEPKESFTLDGRPLRLPGSAGAASLFLALGLARETGGEFRHEVAARDGIRAASAWRLA